MIYSNRFPIAILIDKKLAIATCRSEFEYKDLIKSCGFRWNMARKSWEMSLDCFENNLNSFKKKLGLCEVLCHEFKAGIVYSPPKCKKNPLTDIAVNSLKLKPYQYQIDGINFALENPYSIIGDEMGLGKTPQGIGVLTAFCKPGLIVCPASLKLNWVSEIEKFYGAPTFVIDGDFDLNAKKNKWAIQLAADNWPIIFIINYEIIKKFQFIFKICRHWIVDEAHAFKNPEAQRTKVFKKFVSEFKPETCTFLSGTAITKSVADFYFLLTVCDLPLTRVSYKISNNPNYSSPFRFSNYFSHAKTTNFGTKFIGIKNWCELRRLMENKYIRRSASDYLPDLPELTRSVFICRPDEHRLKSIDAGLKAAYEFMRNGGKFNAETDVSIASMKRGAAELKAKFTAEIAIELIAEGEKVIIFSDHVEACKIIHSEIGKQARLIIGETKQKTRQEICEKFQDKGDMECMAIVATFGALNAGRTLTAARITLTNDLPWLPSVYLQAEKRFHRIGQTEKCLVKIISAPGIDALINKTILDKALVLSQALSYGKETPLEFR